MKTQRVSDAVSVPVAVTSVRADLPLASALQMMRSKRIHHLVVVHEDTILGVVSDRNIFANGTGEDGHSLRPDRRVGDVMIHLEQFVTAKSSLHDALELLTATGASALPIVGPHGLAGIITESDLLHIMRLQLTGTDQDKPAGASVVFSNPLIQEAMRLLANAGV